MFYYRLDVKFRCTYSEWVSKNSQTTNKGTWTSVRPMAVSNAHLWCARVGSWCRWACWRSSPPFRPICCWVTLTSLLTLLCCSVRKSYQYPRPGNGDAQRMERAHRFYCVLFCSISPRERISIEQMNGFIPRTLPFRLTAKASWMRLQMSSTTACTKAWADDHRCLFAGSFLWTHHDHWLKLKGEVLHSSFEFVVFVDSSHCLNLSIKNKK